MKRRTLLALAPLIFVPIPTTALARPAPKTVWRVSSQMGLEACLLMGVLSSPSLQAEANAEDNAYWTPRISVSSRQALMRVRATTDQAGGLLGPILALLGSAAPADTIEATIAAFKNPGLMKAKMAASRYWDGEEDWQKTIAIFPDVVVVLTNLAEVGFTDFWNAKKKSPVDAAIAKLRSEIVNLDLIAAQQRYVRERFNPEIDIYVSALSEPHGISVTGQAFMTSFDYPTEIVKRIATHEMLHPFLRPSRPERTQIIARLSSDPLLQRINSRADKSDGYDGIDGLIEEGMCQALEAIISIRLGYGRGDMGAYWREQDNGIHMFAAAAFHAMNKSGFAARGGDSLAWLARAVRSGEMRGQSLVDHARAVVGAASIAKWIA